MYLNIVKHILSGFLVNFSAKMNHNTSVFINAHNSENNYTRAYKCSSHSSLLEQFALNEWDHTQHIQQTDTDITVRDELNWKHCKGDRIYKVIKIMDDDFKYITIRPWSITTKQYRYKPVVYAMQSKMVQMDKLTFDAFLTSIK